MTCSAMITSILLGVMFINNFCFEDKFMEHTFIFTIKIHIIRMCKVTKRFLFFHKFLDLKIGHIVYTCKTMRKLQSRVNYRSIFRGGVKLW